MSKNLKWNDDVSDYDTYMWGSVDPVKCEVVMYPSKISNKIESAYIDYMSEPENNNISLTDYFGATIHFLGNNYFIQKTPNGLRSVFRREKNNCIEIEVEFNTHYNSWYIKLEKTTHIGLLVDTSGSMYNTYNIIIEKCIEEFLEKQQKDVQNKALFYGITFSDTLNILYDGVDLKTQDDIREKFYSIKPQGMTAYYDAYVEMIQKIGKKSKIGDEVIICCMTDGQDNSSKFSKHYVKSLITSYKKKGWMFVMFGTKEANLDEIDIGLNPNECLEIGRSIDETKSAYKSLNHNISSVRKGEVDNIEFSQLQRIQSNENY